MLGKACKGAIDVHPTDSALQAGTSQLPTNACRGITSLQSIKHSRSHHSETKRTYWKWMFLSISPHLVRKLRIKSMTEASCIFKVCCWAHTRFRWCVFLLSGRFSFLVCEASELVLCQVLHFAAASWCVLTEKLRNKELRNLVTVEIESHSKKIYCTNPNE